MQTIEVRRGQSLMDIAVQEFGTVEAVFDLVQDNNLRGITSNVYHGDELKIRNSSVGNRQKLAYIKVHQPIATITNSERARGIGFWSIGKDFVVS